MASGKTMTEDPEDGADGGVDRKFVTSLARGLDILRAFRAGEHTLTNQQLAERTRLRGGAEDSFAQARHEAIADVRALQAAYAAE